MRHWPVQTLSAEDLRAAHPPLADLARHVQQQIKRRKQVRTIHVYIVQGKLKQEIICGFFTSTSISKQDRLNRDIFKR